MNQFAQILASIQDILITEAGGDETVEAVTSTWKDGLQVLVRKTREGKLVAYVPNNELSNVFTDEQLELLSEAGILEDGGDTRRIAIGGATTACIGLDYDQLRVKAKSVEREASKLIILENKVKTLEKELRIARQDNAGTEAFANVLNSLSDTIATRKSAKPVQPAPRKAASKERALGGVPTLLLSDWHWGEVVDPVQVEHLNEYNLTIAKRRADRVFRSTIDVLTNHMGGEHYESFVCALGGDMLSGNIHEELRETNEEEILEAVLSLHDTLRAGIGLLAKEFGDVYVPCVVGNHGRLDRKPTAKHKVVNNFDWLLYKMLERTFKADGSANVLFDISESADMRYDVYDTRYLFTHGDQIKGGAGVGGIWPSMMKTDQRKRKRHQRAGGGYDYLMCGHFHRFGVLDGIIVNGSLKGYDEWVYTMNFDNEPAQQALWVTHPKYGITKCMPIRGDSVETPEHKFPPISGYSRRSN